MLIKWSWHAYTYGDVAPAILGDHLPQLLISSQDLLDRRVAVSCGRRVKQGLKHLVMLRLHCSEACEPHLVEGQRPPEEAAPELKFTCSLAAK